MVGKARAVIFDWLQWCEYPSGGTDREVSELTMKYIKDLESKNAKLREALEEISIGNSHGAYLARKALAETEGE